MKTSELKKWLKQNDWEIRENEFDIEVFGLVKVSKVDRYIYFYNCSIHGETHFELIEKIFEYTNTPISEREEEKKYYLEFNNQFLYESILENNYQFSSSLKQAFKQSQIDNLPLDFIEAIECGFLKKVEVEE